MDEGRPRLALPVVVPWCWCTGRGYEPKDDDEEEGSVVEGDDRPQLPGGRSLWRYLLLLVVGTESSSSPPAPAPPRPSKRAIIPPPLDEVEGDPHDEARGAGRGP